MAFMLQHNSFSCGTYAIINASNALGGEHDYDTVKELAKTNRRDGTSRAGILRALKKLGYKATLYRTKNPNYAWRWSHKWSDSSPQILLVDNGEHYISVVGKLGERVIVADSGAWSDYNEMGTMPCSRDELLERWAYRGSYCGIRLRTT